MKKRVVLQEGRPRALQGEVERGLTLLVTAPGVAPDDNGKSSVRPSLFLSLLEQDLSLSLSLSLTGGVFLLVCLHRSHHYHHPVDSISSSLSPPSSSFFANFHPVHFPELLLSPCNCFKANFCGCGLLYSIYLFLSLIGHLWALVGDPDSFLLLFPFIVIFIIQVPQIHYLSLSLSPPFSLSLSTHRFHHRAVGASYFFFFFFLQPIHHRHILSLPPSLSHA